VRARTNAGCDAIEAQVNGRLLQADCAAAVTGQLGAGATCYSPESCASDVCLESPYCPSACFTPHVLGASCTDEPLCVPGLHCDRRYAPTAFTCQPLEAQGRFCVDDADCQLGLRCDTGAPLESSWQGTRLWTAPPPSQGVVLFDILAAIAALDGQPDLLGTDAGLLADIFAGATLRRESLLADPQHAAVNTDAWLDAPLPKIPRQRPDGDTVAIVPAIAGGW